MAGTMYAMKPVFELDGVVEVPQCMYALPVIQRSDAAAPAQSADCPPGALQALETRQDAILARLERLKVEVAAYKRTLGLADSAAAAPAAAGPSKAAAAPPTGRTPDLVVRCSPRHPAHSLRAACELLAGAGLSLHTSCHAHCSLTAALPPALATFLPPTPPTLARTQAQVRVTLIWSDVGRDCELMVSPLAQTLIKGEVNVLRYFSRLFPTVLPYESLPSLTAADSALDTVTSLLWAAPRDRQPLMRSLVTNLGKSSFLLGDGLSVADLGLYSAVKQLQLEKELQPELASWFSRTQAQLGGAETGGKKSGKPAQEKGKSPKKEVKKEKSPVKEVKSEKKPQKSGKSDSVGFDKEKLFHYFEKNSIPFKNVDHPAVFTVEAMLPYLKNISGAICKNLFLKDKKKNLYLLSAAHDKDVKLNDVAKAIGAKELRFADEAVLLEKLGVTQGCVTAFALVNNPEKDVKFIVDKKLLDGSHPSVNFHPLVNTATTNIATQDFKKFLSLTGHTVLEI